MSISSTNITDVCVRPTVPMIHPYAGTGICPLPVVHPMSDLESIEPETVLDDALEKVQIDTLQDLMQDVRQKGEPDRADWERLDQLTTAARSPEADIRSYTEWFHFLEEHGPFVTHLEELVTEINDVTEHLQLGGLPDNTPGLADRLQELIRLHTRLTENLKDPRVTFRATEMLLNDLKMVDSTLADYLETQMAYLKAEIADLEAYQVAGGHQKSNQRLGSHFLRSIHELQVLLAAVGSDLPAPEAPETMGQWIVREASEWKQVLIHPIQTLIPDLEARIRDQHERIRSLQGHLSQMIAQYAGPLEELEERLADYQDLPPPNSKMALALLRDRPPLSGEKKSRSRWIQREKKDLRKAMLGMPEGKKRILNVLFTSMQLSQTLIQQYQHISRTRARMKAAAAEEPLVTERLLKKHEKAKSFLGTTLNDKLGAILKMSDEEIVNYCKRYPDVAPILIRYKTSGIRYASSETISEEMLSYDRAHMPSPFEHLSMSEWTEKFLTPQGEEKPEQTGVSIFSRAWDAIGYVYSGVRKRADLYFERRNLASSLDESEGALVQMQEHIGYAPEPALVIQREIQSAREALYHEGGSARVKESLARIQASQRELREIEAKITRIEEEKRQIESELKAIQDRTHPDARSLLEPRVSDIERELAASAKGTPEERMAKIQKAREALRVLDSGPNASLSVLSHTMDYSIRDLLISNKVLQHILGDNFGEGSGYEGMDPLKMLAYLHAHISERIAAYREAGPKTTYFSQIAGLEKLQSKIWQASKMGLAYRMNTNMFIDSYQKAAEGLAPNDSFFFQGGWIGKSGGHSLVYEVVRQADGLYTFRINNLGAGIQYHSKVGGQYLPFSEIVDIAPDKIGGAVFLNLLSQLQSNQQDPWSETSIYERLLPLLGGKDSRRRIISDALMEPQHAGHCPYFSMSALIQQTLGSAPDYQRFEIELQFSTLLNYVSHFHRWDALGQIGLLRPGAHDIVLARKSVEQLARNARFAFDGRILTKAELAFIDQKVFKIQKWIESAEADVERETASSLSSLDMEGLQQEALLLAHGIEATLPFDPTPFSTAPIERRLASISPIDFHGWRFTPERFTADLSSISAQVNEAISGGNVVQAKEAIALFVKQIPLSGADNPAFIQKLSAEEAARVLDQLAQLGKDFLWSRVQAGRNDLARQKYAEAVDQLVAVKLLTLAYAIGETHPNPEGVPIPARMPIRSERIWVKSVNLSIQTYDEGWDDAAGQIGTYWEKIEEESNFYGDFFGLYAFPTTEDAVMRHHWESSHERERSGEWDQGIFWRDVQWTVEYVQKPRIQALIESYTPSLRGKSHLEKAMHLLGRGPAEPPILPPLFFHLRDLAFVTQATAQTEWQSESAPDRSAGIVHYPKVSYDSAQDMWSLSPSILFGTRWSETQAEKVVKGKGYRPDIYNLNNLFDDAQPKLSEEEKRMIYNEHFLKRTLSRDRPYWSQVEVFKGTLREFREHLIPTAQRTLQPLETLALYAGQTQLFTDSRQRVQFQRLMFFPGLLTERLRSDGGPSLARRLAAFARDGYVFATEINDISMRAFFLETNRRFLAHVQWVRIHYPGVLPDNIEGAFLDTRAEWDIIQKRSPPSDVREQLYLTLRAHTASSSLLDGRQIADLIISEIGIRSDLETYTDAQKGFRIATTDLFISYAPQIERALSGGQRDAILNRVSRFFDPKWVDGAWTAAPSYPRFVSGDKEIDLASGYIIERSGVFVALPHRLKFFAGYYGLVDSSGKVSATLTGSSHYEFTGKYGLRFQMVDRGPEDEPQVWLQRDGKWFFAMPSSLIRPQTDEDRESMRTRSWTNRMKNLFQIETDSNAKTHIGEFIGREPLWWVEDGIKSHGGEMISLEEGKVKYTICYGPAPRAEPENALIGLLLDPLMSPTVQIRNAAGKILLPWPHHTLARVGGQQMVWINPESRQAEKIEFPIMQASFTIKDGKAYSDQHPGFILSDNQYLPEFGEAVHYLVIEKGFEKKAIVPRLPFRQEMSFFDLVPFDRETSSFDLQVHTSRMEISDRVPFMIYNLVDDQLVPQNEEARFYFAEIQMRLQRYDAACRMLRAWAGRLRPLSKEEKQRLRAIADLQKENHDADPRAIAIRLQAGWYLKKNQIDFAVSAPVDSHVSLDQLYSNYESIESQIPPRLRLPKSEESELREALGLGRPNDGRPSFVEPKPLPFWDGLKEPDWRNFRSVDLDLRYLIPGTFENPDHMRLDFRKVCSLARESSPKSLRSLLEFAIGSSSLPSLTDSQVRQSLNDLLLVMGKSDPTMAWSLMAILDDPSAFDLSTLGHTWKDAFKEKFIEPVRRYYQRMAPLLPRIRESGSPSTIPFEPHHAMRPDPKRPFAFCPALPPHLFLGSSPVTLSALVERALISPRGADLTFDGDSSLVDEIRLSMEDLDRRVHSYRAAPSYTYRVKDSAAWRQGASVLNLEIASLSSNVSALEVALVSLANRESEDSIIRERQRSQLASRDNLPIDIRTIMHIYSFRDLAELQKQCPGLSLKEAQEMFTRTQEYLILATHLQHLQRTSRAMKKVLAAMNASASADEISTLIEEAVRESVAIRHYDPAVHPEFLVFEYFMNLYMRKEQVANLELFLRKDGAAVEQIMGSGKSYVMLPLIAMLAADGERLSCLVMPEPLIPTMAQMLHERLGASFSRSIEVVEVDRKTDLAGGALNRFFLRLQVAVRDHRPILMSGSSLQSLYLRFVEASQREPMPVEDLQTFRHIFRLFKEGHLVMDEMDGILDILKSHQYTLGAPRQPRPEETLALSSLYETIAEDRELCPYFHFIPGSEKIPLTESVYVEEVAPRLIEHILSGRIGNVDSEIRSFFATLPADGQKTLRRYLSGQADAYLYVQAIPSLKIRNVLAILKEELCGVLMLTSGKEVQEHYGADPVRSGRPLSYLAIPYHGNNRPAIGSQFGTALENMNYAIQMHLAKGITLDMVQNEIEDIRTNVIAEMRYLSRGLTAADCPSYERFLRLVDSVPYNLFALAPHEMLQIQRHINSNPRLQIEFIRSRVLPQIKNYPAVLHAATSLFPLLAPHSKGFSGTLWNTRAFPRAYRHIYMSDTEERTIRRIAADSPEHVVVLAVPSSDVGALVSEIFSERKGSFADHGGLFRGVENREVADAMLARLPSGKKGVAYYDESDQIMVVMKGLARPIPIASCGLLKEEIIAYWDQKHTIGSDIQLAPDMEAAVSVSIHTLMSGLLQAVWRLRGIERGQRVFFVLSEKDRKMIAERLERMTGRRISEITLKDLLFYVKANEATRQAKDASRALR